MKDYKLTRLRAQLAILRDIVNDGYGGHTIDNVIVQLETRVKEMVKN